jgi:hypothetical protein
MYKHYKGVSRSSYATAIAEVVANSFLTYSHTLRDLQVNARQSAWHAKCIDIARLQASIP